MAPFCLLMNAMFMACDDTSESRGWSAEASLFLYPCQKQTLLSLMTLVIHDGHIFSPIGSFARTFLEANFAMWLMCHCWWFDACWWNPSGILLLGRLSEPHSWPDVSGYNGQTCERPFLISLFYSTILVCCVIVLQLKSFTSFKVCLWLPTSNDKNVNWNDFPVSWSVDDYGGFVCIF